MENIKGNRRGSIKMSEFGKGIVICLIKFSEHFERDTLAEVCLIDRLKDKYNPLTKKIELSPLEKYDSETLRNVELVNIIYLKTKSFEECISHMIELWASGASDHLYDIKCPDNWIDGTSELGALIYDKLMELQTTGLKMGHGFVTNTLWTLEDVIHLRKLTIEISLLLDKYLGIFDGEEGVC
jgi:hypothetical protein